MEIIQPIEEAFASFAMIGVLIFSALIVAVMMARLLIDAFDASV